MRSSTVALFSFALALTACASTPTRPQFMEADYPGVLRDPASLPFDVVWQQRVTAFWGEGQQRGFDAAIQKQGDKLTVIGLSPMGSVGFSIVLQGDSVDVQNNTEEGLPFPARFILLDVQRAFYPWIPDRAGQDELLDGERIFESRADGRLIERRFRRDERPEGEIVVRYTWGNKDWRGPTRVDLDNGWFGYRLRIDTHAETLLPVAPGGGP